VTIRHRSGDLRQKGWYQEIAGDKEALKDLSFNTAGIIDVDIP